MLTVSLLGIEKIYPALFDDFVIPEAIDRDNLLDNLRIECAELELLYPNGEFLQMLIGAWSKKEMPIWEKLYNTTTLEYNPIENYDRYEELSIDETSASEASAESVSSNVGVDENFKTGFNSNEFQATEKDENTNSVSSENSTSANNTSNHRHTSHIHGNIGVTTSQQMIESERNVVKFNIVDYIIQSFKERFCLLVY